MIATLISFEAIDIAITAQVDPSTHIVVQQKTSTDYLVVKEGLALRKLFETMLLTKAQKIEEENIISNLCSPLFVCFSAKNRKLTQPILSAICPALQKHIIYFNIDKTSFGSVGFNRAFLEGRQICYGEGLSQLRPKQQLRIALGSILKPFKNVQYIFIERYKEEIKQLKKEGVINIIESFDSLKYQQVYDRLSLSINKADSDVHYPEHIPDLLLTNSFAQPYLQKLAVAKVELPKIQLFNPRVLSMQGFVQRIKPSSIYYNITPKSWINKQNSREISSFVFHSSTDNRLYVARAARPRQFSNQEDIQLKAVTYYLSFLVNPEGFAVPQDKMTALMKFSKIKKFENKGTWFNVRPYIEGLATIKQTLSHVQILELMHEGSLYGHKVRGLGGVLLLSWIVNQNFAQKSLWQQLCFVEKSGGVRFMTRGQIGAIEEGIYLCRSDYFSIFNMSNYKIVNDIFALSRPREEVFSLKLNQFHQSYLFEMCNLLSCMSEERITMIRNLFIQYRWHTNLASYYDVIIFRLQAIREYLAPYMFPQLQRSPSLLATHPQLSCLLIPEDYSYFMLPLKNSYFPLDFSYQDTMAETKLNQNPYFVYMNKACSFLIYNLQFPVLSFMQWIKAVGKYQIIEYISMINNTLQDYLVLDKRLKMASVNEKKNIVLVVDHAECCQELLNRPRSIKTVLVYRLRKPAQNQDMGLVSCDLQKKLTFEQSQNELIRILYKWGKSSQAFSSQFQLYDWILSSYSRIKCSYFDLPVTDNNFFLGYLHKAISTNRHRLKQIQETYKDHAKHLYTLPIVKQQQKIVLDCRLYQFIHIKNLFVQILQGTWNYRLQTFQNASINIWRPIIDATLASRVVIKIMNYLDDISSKRMDAYQFKSLTTDGLEVIRSLTQMPPNKDTLQEPYHLYFQAFLELIKIQNHSEIQASLCFGSFVAIVDQQTIEIVNGLESIKITKSQVRTLAFEGKDHKLVFFTEDSNACDFYINEIELTNTPMLGYTKIFAESIKNHQVKELLSTTQWGLIKIHKAQHALMLALAKENRLTIIVLFIFEQEIFSVKQFALEQAIIDLTFLESKQKLSELLVITSNKAAKYSIFETDISGDEIEIIHVDFGITNALVKQFSGQLHVYLYKLHIIQHYVVVKGQIAAKQRYELKRNIKIMAVEGQLVYVFYESCDALDIMLFHGDQLERLWSYYWVDFNCKAIHVRAEHVYLRGSSYLKHMRIRNTQSLQKKMMKNQ